MSENAEKPDFFTGAQFNALVLSALAVDDFSDEKLMQFINWCVSQCVGAALVHAAIRGEITFDISADDPDQWHSGGPECLERLRVLMASES